MENTVELQEELLKVIHQFHAKGWAQATSTNFSFRNQGTDTCTISKSGIDKGLFTRDDFMVVDNLGNATAAYQQYKPSAETLLHTMLYSQTECKAILHTHSVAATVLSYRYRYHHQLQISGLEIMKGLQGITSHEQTISIPIFKNSQDIPALSKIISAANPAKMHGFLLAGHGLYTWGDTIAQAKRHVETLEFLFECVNALDLQSGYVPG